MWSKFSASVSMLTSSAEDCGFESRSGLTKDYEIGICCSFTKQGSPHLHKIGRLDFSLREHEGEVKAWQGDFHQLQNVFFSHHFLKYLHLKCAFANILLISFIFNFIFMFCICIIIIIDLIFVDLKKFSFCLEICKDIWMIFKCSSLFTHSFLFFWTLA